MKKAIMLFFVLLISASLVFANDSETLDTGKSLVESKAACSDLSDEQLEAIGDYYMEQMHPGELHEAMDERMGGEGSENLKQVHIRIAKSMYCGDYDMMSGGMMNMFGGMMYQNSMMRGVQGSMMNNAEYNNMMGNAFNNVGGKKMAYGMMNGFTGYGMMNYGYWLYCLLWLVVGAFVVSAIFWLTYKWIVIDNEKRSKKK